MMVRLILCPLMCLLAFVTLGHTQQSSATGVVKNFIAELKQTDDYHPVLEKYLDWEAIENYVFASLVRPTIDDSTLAPTYHAQREQLVTAFKQAIVNYYASSEHVDDFKKGHLDDNSVKDGKCSSARCVKANFIVSDKPNLALAFHYNPEKTPILLNEISVEGFVIFKFYREQVKSVVTKYLRKGNEGTYTAAIKAVQSYLDTLSPGKS